MKVFVVMLIFCALTLPSKAGGPYRNYLLSKIYPMYIVSKTTVQETSTTLSSGAFIPRFERPKGAIFCRMEDKVTKATKVWLKIGVQ